MSTRLPRISVVVPSYNQAAFLGEALESIFSQGYPDVEVIVMDGGSTDGSVDVIRSYEDRLRHWQSAPDAGQSAAINEGMTHASGDLVAWLNSDDLYFGEALWHVGRAFSEYPGRGLYIGSGFRYRQAEGRHVPFCRRHVALNRRALREGLDYVLQPSTFFLREAWVDAGGARSDLRYCMDWDLILRISARRAAVTINEFLAVSREYAQTKTASGRLERAFEICRMVREHTGREATAGSLFYLLETLLDVADQPELRRGLDAGMRELAAQFVALAGNADSFPEKGDPGDDVYLPFAAAGRARKERPPAEGLPAISVVTPSFNQREFLGQTLESLWNQGYPKLELLVFDGGSTDGSRELLEGVRDRLGTCVSEPDRGPADAINKGLRRARGEILAWLNSDDLLSDGALWEVARVFQEDPELDMVLGNALYIDEDNRLLLADHGTHRTGLYYGEVQPIPLIPAYWRYVHSVPQPTVFFRRRLLERCGMLDESYHFIFDFELFWRFVQKAKVLKLERVQAFYRIHRKAKTSQWDRFLVELYRFSRPYWPRVWDPAFGTTWRDYVKHTMGRRFAGRPRNLRFWAAASVIALSALTRVGNPEALRLPGTQRRASPPPAEPLPDPELPGAPPRVEPSYAVDTSRRRYQSAFCAYLWPRHPGLSGGEIRDFHLLRRLLALSEVEFFSVYPVLEDGRDDPLRRHLRALNAPENRPGLGHRRGPAALPRRALDKLRRLDWPVLGPRYHLDADQRFGILKEPPTSGLADRLRSTPHDFLLVSPQNNPVALTVDRRQMGTRFILASYDVEAVRLSRFAASERGRRGLALSLEARRAARFETENLRAYDGILAVSELDRQIFQERYGFAPGRIAVVENGVDTEYFSFRARRPTGRPEVVYVGSLGYPPNAQAARRLVRRIFPRVRAQRPDAFLWIVGQGADPDLLAESDGTHVAVTGRVADVRPYLDRARVACVPLLSGSGTKYKILEALSAGVPLVSSPLGLEGLELASGESLLLGETDEELADAILKVIEDDELSRRLAAQGRAAVERRYSWDVNLPRLDAFLEELARLPRR